MRRRSPPPLPVLIIMAAAACAPPADDSATSSIPRAEPTYGDSLSGAALAGVLGCGACHPGAPAPGRRAPEAPSLEGLGDRWGASQLTAYLMDPAPLRPGTVARMPDFHLDSAEAAAVVSYLLDDSDHPDAGAAVGRAIVRALNCAGCHEGTGTEPWPAGPPITAVGERLRRGWLSTYLGAPRAVRPFGYHPGSGSRMPDFRLSPAEVDSLTTWLAGADPAMQPDPAVQEGSAADRRLSPFAARKAETLLRETTACLGCHSLSDEGGRIGPALDGLARRLRPDYLRRVVLTPDQAVPGTMMPAPLEDSATLALIIRYLAEGADTATGGSYLSLVTNRSSRPNLTTARTGGELYAHRCAACHGERGHGDGFNAAHLPVPPTAHADGTRMGERADATLFDGIHGGGHILGRSHRMPAFGGSLTSSQIEALVDHIRALCGCDQPAWAVSR